MADNEEDAQLCVQADRRGICSYHPHTVAQRRLNTALEPMSALSEVLKRVGDVADFADVEVTDPNTLGYFRNRPLHVAAVWGDCGAIRILVEAGARIDEPGEHGFTPLMEATAQGNLEACELLVSLGALPVRNEWGQLPSEHAAVDGKSELAAWLASNGF